VLEVEATGGEYDGGRFRASQLHRMLVVLSSFLSWRQGRSFARIPGGGGVS